MAKITIKIPRGVKILSNPTLFRSTVNEKWNARVPSKVQEHIFNRIFVRGKGTHDRRMKAYSNKPISINRQRTDIFPPSRGFYPLGYAQYHREFSTAWRSNRNSGMMRKSIRVRVTKVHRKLSMEMAKLHSIANQGPMQDRYERTAMLAENDFWGFSEKDIALALKLTDNVIDSIINL